MRTTLACSLALLLLIGAAPAGAEGETPINRDIAQKHWELGQKLYQASNHAAALVEFEKAYKLAQRPSMLFNIARCHEVMGALEKAVDFYERYLKQNPDDKNRGLVQTRIANIRATMAKKNQPAVAAATAASEPAPAPRNWKRTLGWAGLGAGCALLATGAVIGVLAQDKAYYIPSKTFVFLAVVKGKHYALAKKTSVAVPTAPTLKVVVKGDLHSMYLDNNSVLSEYKEPSLTSGKIGLMTFKAAGEFDNFKVTCK